MKIDSLTHGSTPPTGKPASRPPRAEAQSSDTAAEGAVRLSETSTGLSANGGEPTYSAARVQEIRQAISEGRFQINASAIADRLITSARELLQNHRPS